MKKLFLCFIILVSVFVRVGAVDFGGLLASDTEFTKIGDESFAVAETADAILNLRVPFSKDGRSYMVAEGMYRFEVVQDDLSHILDMPLLKVNFALDSAAGVLNVSAGRYGIQDITGKIFLQPTDGLSFVYSSDSVVSSVYAGYTGLINSKTTDMVEVPSFEPAGNDLYVLSLPYLVFSGGVELPYLAFNQTLLFDLWGFVGTQGLGKNSVYTSLAASGPLAGTLFHTTGASFLVDITDAKTTFGFLADFNLVWNLPSIRSNVLASFVYASKNFNSITSQSPFVTGVHWNNLMTAGLCFSVVPVSSVYVGAETMVLFDVDEFGYKGTQFSGKAKWQILSDVHIAGVASYFMASENVDSVASFTIEAAISF